MLRWIHGRQTHQFSVEKGISHELQANLDIVLPMHCSDLHVNVQDAAGDRILAGDLLKRDPTNWAQWVDTKGVHRLGKDKLGRIDTGEGVEEEHVHDVVGLKVSRGFSKTPRVPRHLGQGDSCRIYGSLELNKVQGDFHITARGHGYMGYGEHLDHSGMSLVRDSCAIDSQRLTPACISLQLLTYHK